jgi:hypothetical protein
MWVAALTEDENKRAVLVNALDRYLRETPDRVPFGDWYFTDDGKYRHFRARTVQGGCFILLAVRRVFVRLGFSKNRYLP